MSVPKGLCKDCCKEMDLPYNPDLPDATGQRHPECFLCVQDWKAFWVKVEAIEDEMAEEYT